MSSWEINTIVGRLMLQVSIKLSVLIFFAIISILDSISYSQGQESNTNVISAIPKVWDEEALNSMTLPSANPGSRILYVSSSYYYTIPVMPMYKSYPVYAPGKEPPGYLDWLKKQEPEVVFDPVKLKTQKDWIEAGRIIFDTPFDFKPINEVREREWYEKIKPPLMKGGAIAAYRYVIRKRGEVEVGLTLCGSCHTRVMPDGSVIKGAQGNFPIEQDYAYRLRKSRTLEGMRKLDSALVYTEIPKDELNGGLYKKSLEEVAAAHDAMIPGVVARPGFSVWDMPKIADIIGLKDRRYLDLTARLQQRSIADLMRYAAFCAGGNYFFSSATTLPSGVAPEPNSTYRPSDEQLYALALYIYSLQPPPNLNKFDAVAARGKEVFEREGCVMCHTPPLYTNNKLTPAGKFQIPEDHLKRYGILDYRVGTDERSATVSVRGRGYYKVPSIKGVWYRGPLEHNGSVATLEDWFDPRRTKEDYVPTGFKGYGVKARAVKGHLFGLDLSVEDRRALIAFLRTL
jgi:hypothetical protein